MKTLTLAAIPFSTVVIGKPLGNCRVMSVNQQLASIVSYPDVLGDAGKGGVVIVRSSLIN